MQRAGGIPLVLPVVDPDDIGALLDAVDAVVITGGGDIDPASYGHTPAPELGPVDPRRDASDLAVARAVVERNVPTLAVCRGIQIVNVARGLIIDEAALTQALREGRIAGAGLDVAETEPMDAANPLWGMPNVIITPHVANDSDLGYDAQMKVVQENLRRYTAGEPMLSVVDVQKGY